MQINPEFIAPRPPVLCGPETPEDEKVSLQALEDNLGAMRRECNRLVADIALFELCVGNPEQTLHEWLLLGARDGALALRNFAQALRAVRKLIGRCRSVASKVDTTALKRVDDEFNKRFPRVDKLRHSVAHPEYYANPDIDMSTNEPFMGTDIPIGVKSTIQESIFKRTFVTTINGMTTQYEITPDTSLAVVRATKDAFDAFSNADRRPPGYFGRD